MLNALPIRRSIVQEIMDRPDLDPAAHRLALEGLRRINRVSHTAEQMLAPILDLARRQNLTRLSLLDVACGGGDVPITLASAAATAGLTIDLTLLDRSPIALAQAADTAAHAGLPCRTIQADVLATTEDTTSSARQPTLLTPSSGTPGEGWGGGLAAMPQIMAAPATGLPPVDVVTNSLFLHHLEHPAQVVQMLSKMSELAQRMVVVSDLRRCRRGLIACWIGCRLLSRSPIVHHDGPVSVRASWTMSELSQFAAQAGLNHARIQSSHPWRMLLVWERSHPGKAA